MKALPWIVAGAAGIGIYMALKPKTAEASSSGVTTDENGSEPVTVPSTDQPANQPAIAKRKGQLVVKLALRVSSMEKMFANPTDILRDVLKGARTVAKTLPTTCPGAPALMVGPTGTIASTNDGYSITLAWDAVWARSGTGPVKAIVRDCLIKQVRKEPKINERFISLTAVRTSAYA